MSKHKTIDVWNRVFGAKQEAYDYTGRLMKKSACGNPNSDYHPTLDHIPHWKANGAHYHARRVKGSRVEYEIIED